MSDINSIAKDLAKIIKEPDKKKTSPYDTPAQVIRIEDSVAWVHIPGGVSETPVKLTVNAQVGDIVQVRVAGGRAWITGNESAPPTDDRTANIANANAKVAHEIADNAQAAADEAYTAAETAVVSANIAQAAAESAETSATQANKYAVSALNGLSEVEKVVDVLEWIATHGEYALTQDETVQEGKFYFTRAGSGTEQDPYIYTKVENPTGDPSVLGYYELTGVDEAITNYVSTHLALLDDGLYVTMDDSGYRVKVTNQAVQIINNLGDVISTYSADTVIGSSTEENKNVYISNNTVQLREGMTTYLRLQKDTTSPYVLIGNYAEEQQNLLLRPTGIWFRTRGFVDLSIVYDSANDTPNIVIGRTGTGQKNVRISNNALQTRTGTVVDATFGATTIIGHTGAGQKNILINDNGVQLRNGTTVIASLNSSGKFVATSAEITGDIKSGSTITGSTISGGTVSGTTVTGSTIQGNTITGGTITGTTISGSVIKTQGAESQGVVRDSIELKDGVLRVIYNDGTSTERVMTAQGAWLTIDGATSQRVTLTEQSIRFTDKVSRSALSCDAIRLYDYENNMVFEAEGQFSGGKITTGTRTHDFGGTNLTCGTSTTSDIVLWGNSTIKVGVGVTNTQDNKQFYLQARTDELRLTNNTDSTTLWQIKPNSYLAGESVSFSENYIYCTGHLTNSSKSLDFFIPLPRSASGRTCTLSLNASNGLSVRLGVGGYLNGTQYIDTTTSDYTITTSPSSLGVRVRITKSTAYTGASNNMACSVAIAGTLTFS